MQLYSLLDQKGREARLLFDLDRGSWVNTDIKCAERVRDWARQKAVELTIVDRLGRVALHCPAAGRYWHPKGVDLQYYLDEIHELHEAQSRSQQLREISRQIDVNTISALFDSLEEYFGGPSDRGKRYRKAIAIARDALGRLA
jgi:hypothetical protein